MADAYVSMGLREKRAIQAVLTPDSATVTISTATVTLKDASNAVAGGVSNAAVTGNTSGASATPAAWYDFDPTTLALTGGYYIMEFLIVDSSGYKYEPTVGINLVTD